jgi:hypothetical protein
MPQTIQHTDAALTKKTLYKAPMMSYHNAEHTAPTRSLNFEQQSIVNIRTQKNSNAKIGKVQDF